MAVDITSLAIKVTSSGITTASKALGGLSTSAANSEKRVTALTLAMDKLNNVNKLAETSANTYMVKLREQAALYQSLAANSRTAAGGTQALAAAMTLLAASLNLVNTNLQVNNANQRRSNDSMREAHALARGLSGSLGALWLTYGNFAGMAVGLGIGAALKGIVTIGADVENTLEGIRVRGGETIESANKVRDAIYKIGEGVYGPQEVAKAFESLTLAGLKVKESSLAIGAALNLATSGGTTIEKAAEGLVSIGTAVGATAGSFDYLADGITAAANTSLASVDSITESVKRASIVNKLYGASFEDILTQTAALAQLGIKNTAAGTAITNFYSNAVGNTEKSRKALDALGMSFTDATGKAKPLVEAFEDFSSKLNKYDLKSQQNFINDIFGERALRDVEAMRSLINKSADDTNTYSNKLREIQGQIGDAAGTASLQAVQLGMSAQKQMLAVGNTLKTSLAKAFEELSPQIMYASSNMKAAFGSPEFIAVVTNLASALGSLVTFVAENAAALAMLVEGLVLFKAAAIMGSILTPLMLGLRGVALEFGVITIGATGATVATTAFGTAVKLALGWAAPVITAVALAMALLAFHNDDAAEKALKYADTYNKDFAKALEDEANRLETINKLKAEGKTQSEALAGAMKNEAIARYTLNSEDLIAASNKRVGKAREAVDGPLGHIVMTTAKQIELNKAVDENTKLLEERDKVWDNTSKIQLNSEVEKQGYKADEYVNDILTNLGAGTKVYDRKKEDVAGNNDIYAAQLKSIEGKIEASRRILNQVESSSTSKFKAGLISEFDQIDAISDARIKKLSGDVKLYQDMLNLASPKNKRAVAEAIGNKQDNAQDLLDKERQNREDEYSVALNKMQEDNYKVHAKMLTLQGRNEEAAVDKSKRLYEDKIATEQATLLTSLQKLSSATGPEAEQLKIKVIALSQHIAGMQGEMAAMIATGKLDDAELATSKALETLRINISAINAQVPKGGLLVGIAADESIRQLKDKAIPAIQELYDAQKKLADLKDASPDAQKKLADTGDVLDKLKSKSGGADAWKAAQESLRAYGKEAEDVGTLIGGAMTNAFKGAEDALTNFIMTGKFNFRGLATSIIADLARIQAKQLLMSTMGAGGGATSGLLKMGLGALGAAFGGMAGGYSAGFSFGNAGVAASSGLSIADLGGAFADGGDPPVGVASMVGEVGPELFVPKEAGTIIPNHMLSMASAPKGDGSGSGNDRPVNYTIVNQTTGRIDEVVEQKMNGNDRALIIKEAVNAVASSLYDANSNISKGMRNTHNVQRSR